MGKNTPPSIERAIEEKERKPRKKRITEIFRSFLYRMRFGFDLYEAVDIASMYINGENLLNMMKMKRSRFLTEFCGIFSFSSPTDTTNTTDTTDTDIDVDNNIYKSIVSSSKITQLGFLKRMYFVLPSEIQGLFSQDLFSLIENGSEMNRIQKRQLAVLCYFVYLFTLSRYNLNKEDFNFTDFFELILPNPEILINTPQKLAQEKSRDFPPPNRDLKFVIQVPIYNEFPKDGRITPSNLGNFFYFLDSFFAAVSEYINRDNTGRSAREFELLLNINNNSGIRLNLNGREINGTYENYLALKLVSVINSPEGSYEDELEEFLSLLTFCGSSDELDRLRESYKTLIKKGRELVSSGLRILVVDCTDGSYITRLSERHPILLRSNQASRRLLLNTIARERASQLSNGDVWHIHLDGDLEIHPSYFDEITDALLGVKVTRMRMSIPPIGYVLLPPPRFTKHAEYQLSTQSGEQNPTYDRNFLNFSSFFYLLFLWSTLKSFLPENLSKRVIISPSYLSLLCVNNVLFSRNPNADFFDMYGEVDGTEDYAYYRYVRSSSFPYRVVPIQEGSPEGLVSIPFRVRPESFGGRSDVWGDDSELISPKAEEIFGDDILSLIIDEDRTLLRTLLDQCKDKGIFAFSYILLGYLQKKLPEDLANVLKGFQEKFSNFSYNYGSVSQQLSDVLSIIYFLRYILENIETIRKRREMSTVISLLEKLALKLNNIQLVRIKRH